MPSYTSALDFENAIDIFLKKERVRFTPSPYEYSWRKAKNQNEVRLTIEFDDLEEGYPIVLNFRVFGISSL